MQINVATNATVAHVEIANPGKLNALTPQGFADLAEAFEGLAAQENLRVVTLRGQDGAFCAGAELAAALQNDIGKDDSGDTLRDMFDRGVNKLMRAMRNIPVPLLTIVDGTVAGGGVGMALAADFIVASRRSCFHIPFGPNLALVPDCGASWLLPCFIGRTRAMALALLDGAISADEAHRLGLISRLVDDDRIDPEAAAIVDQLAQGPTEAIIARRRLFDRAQNTGFDDFLELERAANTHQSTQDDFHEGVAALLEKRPPRFSGGSLNNIKELWP